MRSTRCQGVLNDSGSDEDQQFLLVVALNVAPEQPANIRQVAQERGLRCRDVLVRLEDATKYHRLTVVNEHLRFNLIGVDRGHTIEHLPDYGYFPSGKKDEYLIYETESDLRDYENIPLKESAIVSVLIHAVTLKAVVISILPPKDI